MGKILYFPTNRTGNKQNESISEDTPNDTQSEQKKSDQNSVIDFISNIKATNLKEANKQIAEFNRNLNAKPLSDFLGLSANDMQRLLYTPFKNGEFLTIEDSSLGNFAKVPLILEGLYLLQAIESSPGHKIKLTQKGNLPRKLVHDFWSQFCQSDLYTWKPTGEEDLFECAMCRSVLEGAGLLRKVKGEMHITKAGKAALAEGPSAKLYRLLFDVTINKWNWGYANRFEDIPLIQMAGLFSLFALKKIPPDEPFDANKVSKLFLRAFPAATQDVRHVFETPEESVSICFEIQFLKRFGIPMGIITAKDPKARTKKNLYELTPLFKAAFKFTH